MQFWKAGFNVSVEKQNLKLDRRGDSLRLLRAGLGINPVIENLPYLLLRNNLENVIHE
jgi:hypothetical protein